jgi:hypothetical protein
MMMVMNIMIVTIATNKVDRLITPTEYIETKPD